MRENINSVVKVKLYGNICSLNIDVCLSLFACLFIVFGDVICQELVVLLWDIW